jgi:membrane fusion protein (multidrug efflux system)
MTPVLILVIAAALVAVLLVLFMVRVLPLVGFIALAVVVAIIGILVSIKVSQVKMMMGMKWNMPATTVTAAVATAQSWQPILSAVGSLTAVQGVTVAAQLDGNITKIAFQAGTAVKAGDLLLQQDVSSEEAQLHAAEAATELAQVNLKRSHELLASSTISQSQYDTDDANSKQAVAQAENIRAVIDKKTIRAPFSGQLGVRLVNLGQTLKAGDPIVSLQALDPIYADFYLPQQDLALIGKGMTVRIAGDRKGARIREGKITAISPDVDSATRNVRVEATFTNASGALHPGMYVDVDAVLPEGKKVVVIPATSVLYAPYGDSVFVIDDKPDGTKVVRQQFIRLGERRGDFVAVVSGLKVGETVVSTGSFTLHNGFPVKIDNTLAPAAKLAPEPDDS